MINRFLNFLRKLLNISTPPVQEPPRDETISRRIPLKLCVGILDGLEKDGRDKVDVPLNEAIAFVERYTQFKIELTTIVDPRPHDYFSWMQGGEEVWDMLRDQLPPLHGSSSSRKLVDTMPTAHLYLFLFKMFGRRPGRGGSTMGVSEGILKGGLRRPYSTITADVAQYGPQPYEGFTTQRAQIIAHELVNALNSLLAVAPWFCTPMPFPQEGLPAYEYESTNLKALTPADYQKLRVGGFSETA